MAAFTRLKRIAYFVNHEGLFRTRFYRSAFSKIKKLHLVLDYNRKCQCPFSWNKIFQLFHDLLLGSKSYQVSPSRMFRTRLYHVMFDCRSTNMPRCVSACGGIGG